MKSRFLCLCLAGALLLGLTACASKSAGTDRPTPTPGGEPASPRPDPAPTQTPEPTPTPFAVRAADMPPGEYEPWQEAYAALLTDLRQQEGELETWFWNTENASEDMERWLAFTGRSQEYSLYDVDGDSFPELFIKYNDQDGPGMHWICYTFRDGQVVKLGEIDASYAALYTCPEDVGVIVYMQRQGTAYADRYFLENGVLSEPGRLFYEELVNTDRSENTPMEEILPGSERIPTYRWLWSTEPAEPCPIPLTLPIYDYNALPRQAEPCLERAEVQAAIGRVLWEGESFFGVSGDGLYGDTGWTTFEKYLDPGGAFPYDDPFAFLTPMHYAFSDVNGDGQEDCIVSLAYRYTSVQNEAGEWVYVATSVCHAVFSVQDGTVYAYFFSGSADPVVLPDGSFYFCPWYKDYGVAVRFYGNQCYTLIEKLPVEGDGLVWEPFPAEKP